MSKKKTENLLKKVLLLNGRMSDGLYEYELEEHIDYWYEGLINDQEEFVFIVTENSGDVAMALITTDKTVYINEEAKQKLLELWSKSYLYNMKILIPQMVDDLNNGIISVNGVKTVA